MAIRDGGMRLSWTALRLSQAMTHKSAAAELPLGGGKGVIIADPHNDKTEALLRAYARFVDTLGGRYITTTDVGSTSRDLEYIALETKHVAGLPTSLGGSGDTSVMTGLGIYMGNEGLCKILSGAQIACRAERWPCRGSEKWPATPPGIFSRKG